MFKQGVFLALFVFLSFMAPALSAVLSVAPGDWYAGIQKPWFNPPNWVFGPVWTILYVLMGVAAWLVWRNGEAHNLRLPLALFGLQLFLNALWTPLFFGLQRPDLALVNILVLWVAIAATGIAFYPISRTAAFLFLPYWLWVSFAALLNASLWWLNRGT